MLSDESVPDPGEAFWAAMPGRIYREVRAQQPETMLQKLFGGTGRPVFRRWTWAAAAAVLLVTVALFLDRPETPEIAYINAPENGPSYGDLLSTETVDMTELTDVEIDSVNLWATDELAQLQEDAIDIFRTSPDITLDDRLAELDSQELEQLSKMLDTQDEEG
jgi:hypothetical protein